ncbi:hypothetical protein BN77_2855 [Rhizobium mesoamericanum STM3625]|uniref:Uncharacterized protein n=1 Tax=Rhizobium mesoamericanum STM3625 TaxID=1211777 RepID=K0PVW5_9HYPH|nr:hypothetical protein BN77_2855 [Rhizobium mesoamericanum STM3625]
MREETDSTARHMSWGRPFNRGRSNRHAPRERYNSAAGDLLRRSVLAALRSRCCCRS